MNKVRFMITQDLQQLLSSVLEDLGLDAGSMSSIEPSKLIPEVVQISDEKFGDVTTNIAMVIFSQSRSGSDNSQSKFKSPRELAEAIKERIMNHESRIKNKESKGRSKSVDEVLKNIVKTEVAGPGFINFTFSEHFLLEQLGQGCGEKTITKKKSAKPESQNRIIVEYTDPNPFKEFHLGHLYSNIVGESLARLFEYSGAEVRRVCYQGDVGMHVAKSIFGLMEKFEARNSKHENIKAKLENLEAKPLKERVKFLGQAYALGANTEDESAKEEIKSLNAHIFVAAQKRMVEEENWQAQIDYSQIATIDPDKLKVVDLLFRAGRRWSLEAFEEIYLRLGTKFEDYYFESVVGEYGYKIVKEHLGQVFEESKGAIIFPGSKHGLHDRVFINSLGLPTYEAKELGLAPKKYADWEYDKSFIITGNEINEYFKVLLKAMSLTHPELAEKTNHIGHGMLRLPEGKMSSRTGNVLTGETILDEAKSRVMDIFEETESSLDSETREVVADQVGKAAIKYALLRANIGADVIFDFDQSINFQGNSGPYVQYTFARCISLVRKSQIRNSKSQINSNDQNPNESNGSQILDHAMGILYQIDWQAMGVEMNDEERSILRWLWQFELAVERAASEYAPHHVATYVYELAQRFNSFYNKHSILGGDRDEAPNSKSQITNKSQISNSKSQINSDFETTVLFRLAITAQVARTLEVGLGLLGIEAPAKM